MASLMLATADRLSNQRQGGRCEQRSNRRRCPRCRGGARDFTRRCSPVTERTYQRLRDGYRFQRRAPILVRAMGVMVTSVLVGRNR
jgi:hypothetical protein